MIKGKRLLVVSAHAADYVWRSGGTIAKYIQEGAEVCVVVLTFGVRGESNDLWKAPGATAESVKEVRKGETLAAAEILGVKNIEFWDYEDYLTALAQSFLVSADNAHAVHPNHKELTDPTNRPYIGGGIVIKYNAQQKYCTDGYSAAYFRTLCEKAGVACQTFANRSDMPGGSTLGNISNTRVAVNSVDIGLPQLAMHSPYETAGTADTEALVKAMEVFFAQGKNRKSGGAAGAGREEGP